MALTVLEVVLLGRLGQLRLRMQPADLDAVRTVLQSLDIAALAGRYLAELSGGQRQMVFLAQALVAQPRLLLLDEPISALDVHHQLTVLERVRQLTRGQGLTTLLVLHDLQAAARYCDDLLLLRQGTVAARGTPVLVYHAALAAGETAA
jgi:iron complex transport system ATP-binding protein